MGGTRPLYWPTAEFLLLAGPGPAPLSQAPSCTNRLANPWRIEHTTSCEFYWRRRRQ
jgi:hypothetical protein